MAHGGITADECARHVADRERPGGARWGGEGGLGGPPRHLPYSGRGAGV